MLPTLLIWDFNGTLLNDGHILVDVNNEMNRRHGFGIYYYANGDIWYGPYENDIRNGYGVLFTEADGILLGEWRGEQVTKVIPVRFK